MRLSSLTRLAAGARACALALVLGSQALARPGGADAGAAADAASAPPLRAPSLTARVVARRIDGAAPVADRRPATPQQRVFPLRGAHSYGTATNHFGQRAGGHDGQDVLAACGLPLVAVTGGRVQQVADQPGGAGRYVVLDRAHAGEDDVYMHLQSVAVRTGERLRAGARIGTVGRTGDATTCHLHFERWTAPGWYEGGSPIDPLPLLRRLEA